MRKLTLLLCCSLCCSIMFSCQPASNKQPVAANVASSIVVDAIPVDSGWGYMIVVDGKPFIKQDYIPAIAGNQAFKTKEDAEKIGQWVADKMKNNERINVTTNVLKELGIK